MSSLVVRASSHSLNVILGVHLVYSLLDHFLACLPPLPLTAFHLPFVENAVAKSVHELTLNVVLGGYLVDAVRLLSLHVEIPHPV